MTTVWANEAIQWDGFRPVPYSLDFSALELPITKKRSAADDVQTTVGELYSELKDKDFEFDFERGTMDISIRTSAECFLIEGPSFNRDILGLLLYSIKHGFSIFDVTWFWYASDTCTEGIQVAYSFFLVANNTIVQESFKVGDYSGSGFNPLLLKTDDLKDSLWSSEPAWCDAFTKYWYQRFYTETVTGQLMVLRSDEPALHQFRREGTSAAGSENSRGLKQIRNLLWALVLIGIINLLIR